MGINKIKASNKRVTGMLVCDQVLNRDDVNKIKKYWNQHWQDLKQGDVFVVNRKTVTLKTLVTVRG